VVPQITQKQYLKIRKKSPQNPQFGGNVVFVGTIRARHAATVASRKLTSARGIVVNGPRQAGKSELLRLLHDQNGGTLLTLDQPQHLRLARTDPTGFVRDRPLPLMIDEVQRGGDPLVLAIKVQLDSSPNRGQIALAGSTRFLTEPRLSESLAGRIRFVDLWPFSQGEVNELGPTSDRLLDRLFGNLDELFQHASQAPKTSRTEVFDRICIGGFPEAVLASTARDRAEFFADYVRTISQRDISEISRMADRIALPQVLRLLSERTASIANTAKFAEALGTSHDSMRRFLPLVDTIFLSLTLPAFASSAAARTRRKPKLHVTDTGLAASMLGVTPQRLLSPDATISGQLFESFVVMELVKQSCWADELVSFSHFRDADDREVDLVIEVPDGRIVAVEMKAAIDVDNRDFRHLAYLRDRFGDRFCCGVVVHCGAEPARWGDRLMSIPVSALWSPAS
jgi:uncharacterized protein